MPKFWWPMAAAVLLSLPCQAQTSTSAAVAGGPTLTLAEAFARAIANSPKLSAARHEIAALQAAREQAGLWQNPVLELQQEGTRRPERETTVTLSQLIEVGGKRTARAAAADSAVALARAQVEATEAELRSSVTAAWFQALIAQERVKFAQTTLASAKSTASVTARLVAAGKVSPVDETRTRIAESQASIEFAQAEGEQRTAMAALALLVGHRSSDPLLLQANLRLPSPVSADDVRDKVMRSATYRQGLAEGERLSQLAALQRAGRTPDLTVTVGTKRLEDPGRNLAVIGVALPLPLFHRNQAAEHEAQRRADRARDEAAATALQLEVEALRHAGKLASARREADMLEREVLPAAQRNHDAAVRGFELGKFGSLEVLDAQRTYFQARMQHLRALAEAHGAAAELMRLLGTESP